MELVTPPLTPIFSHLKIHHSISIPEKSNSAISMSQDYQHGIFSFSNGFERPAMSHHEQQHHHHHLAQQIRRDKLRVQGGFEQPPPQLVGIDEEESGGLPVYETAGMLSEMFNFPSGGATAADLLEQPMAAPSFRTPRSPQPVANEWYGSNRQGMVVGLGPLGDAKNQTPPSHHHHHHAQISSINAAESAAAMQLFLMNPQPRSPSPPVPPSTSSSTLHMLLPNPSSTSLHQGFAASGAAGGAFGQFTWVPDHSSHDAGRVVESQGLSLSLSSSLQHLEAAKAEELRMGDGGSIFYYNQGAGSGSSSSPAHQYYKNLGGPNQTLHLQGMAHNNHQIHSGFGSSSLGVMNVLRNSKYVKAAQELLEEFCSVGRGQFKKNKFGKHNNANPNSINPGNSSTSGAAGSSSSSKDLPPLSATDRIEHQRRKVKLLSMLDEVDRRYNHYCEQMQMVMNSFDLVMGFGAAVPYTSLAQKAMSRHFRCLKDAISAQLKHSCELLGDKDGAATSGITKGETPRLKLLEQSLRQQRAFHQMGMMEQEAWRPQRGLPERSVNILRAWLFEHFLHPYPSDADKHLLARQTGLSRNQVSNWFINARVRLWKPMVEEMYQQEAKDVDEEDTDQEGSEGEIIRNQNMSNIGLSTTTTQTPTSTTTATTPTSTTTATTKILTTTTPTGKRSHVNVSGENDPSLIAINRRHCFSENQAKLQGNSATNITTTAGKVSPPVSSLCFPMTQDMSSEDTCRRGSVVAAEFGTISGNADNNIGSTLIRFGTTAGDVSLTLGLRHAGNMPDKSSFSVRDFGGC